MRSAHTVSVMTNYVRCVRANLAAEMGRRDLTQAEVAVRVGLAPDALSRRMTGEIEFRLGELMRLAAALEVPFSTVVEGLDKAELEVAR